MKVKYPNPSININKNLKVKTLGMMLENELNITNEYYRIHNKALIYKKPTPVQVIKVEYKSRQTAKIIEAYYKTPSTTDYNGIYRGKYIDFEAKETNYTAFPLAHIAIHQIEHLQNAVKHGGIAFVIIYYKKANEVYIVDIKTITQIISEDRIKSISLEVAMKYGKKIKRGYTPPIDYLKAVDELYFKDTQ